jgi:transcription elongation GreA/GreB family factor
MRETSPKVTANNDKITISFDKKIRLGPLHTLIEGYLQLPKNQQKELTEYMESLLEVNERIAMDTRDLAISPGTKVSIQDLGSKNEKVLHIVKNHANPIFLTTKDIEELYRHYLGQSEKISISTIQTYLNRFVDEGIVERQEGVGPNNTLGYRIKSQDIQI